MSSLGPPPHTTLQFIRSPTPNRKNHPNPEHLQKYTSHLKSQRATSHTAATQTPHAPAPSSLPNAHSKGFIAVDDEVAFKLNSIDISQPEQNTQDTNMGLTTGQTEQSEGAISADNITASPKPKSKPKPTVGTSRGVELKWDVEGTTESSDDEGGEDARNEDKFLSQFATALTLSNRDSMAIKKIGTCDGLKPDALLKWLRNLDIVRDPVSTAKAASTGPLGVFMQKQVSTNWSALRAAIANHFISGAFQHNQRDALLSTIQRAGESLAAFNYEFEALVREGYDRLPEDQTDLIRTYLSNLHDRKLALAVLNKKPQTLEETMRMTTERDKASDFLKPRGGRVALLEEQPTDHLAEHLQSLTTTVNSLAEMQISLANQVAQVATIPPTAPVRDTMRCYRCNQPGHFARECRTQANTPSFPRNTQNNNPGTITQCQRCKRNGHSASQCRAGPPSRPCFCGERHWAFECPRQVGPQRGAPSHSGN